MRSCLSEHSSTGWDGHRSSLMGCCHQTVHLAAGSLHYSCGCEECSRGFLPAVPAPALPLSVRGHRRRRTGARATAKVPFKIPHQLTPHRGVDPQ